MKRFPEAHWKQWGLVNRAAWKDTHKDEPDKQAWCPVSLARIG
jgi:hypothetical protein